MIKVKRTGFIYRAVLLCCFLLSACSSGDNKSKGTSDETETPATIYSGWQMTSFTEWNADAGTCDGNTQTSASLFWKFAEDGQLVKYVTLSEILGGFCSKSTFSILVEDSQITVYNADGNGTDKIYRYALSGNELMIYDDEESVDTCQEVINFSEASEEIDFEEMAETCQSLDASS